MKKETIIVEAKEFLKGKHKNGRPWHLAKILDGEKGRWFVTFDGKSVFKHLSFKEIHSGDLLEVEYENKSNGKYADFVLRSVQRPEFPEVLRSPNSSQQTAPNEPEKENTFQIEHYFTGARIAVSQLIDSLEKKDSITQETILRAIVEVALEWMRVAEGDKNGNL